MTDIDMFLFRVFTAITPIVTTVQTATVEAVLMFLFLLVESGGQVFLSLVIILHAIVIFTVCRHHHVGDIVDRIGSIGTVLGKGKHIAATPALAEIQLFIATAAIATFLAFQLAKLVNGNDFDFRHHARLGHGGANEK